MAGKGNTKGVFTKGATLRYGVDEKVKVPHDIILNKVFAAIPNGKKNLVARMN
jgi:hypothetical protein